MKLKSAFITHDTEGEQILIDTAGKFSGLARSNSTAAFIVEQLKAEISPDEIVSRMLEKYDAPKEVIEADVNKIIEKLKGIGAIEE